MYIPSADPEASEYPVSRFLFHTRETQFIRICIKNKTRNTLLEHNKETKRYTDIPVRQIAFH